MPTIVATDSPYSVLKYQPKMLRDLAPNESIQIPKGTKLAMEEIAVMGIHKLIEIKGALTLKKNGVTIASLYNGDRYYIAPGQWDYSKVLGMVKSPVASDRFALPVPYYPQTDNRNQPNRTCNSSSCAMVAKFLGAKIDGDDDYWINYVNPEGDSTDHSAQTRALDNLDIYSEWHTDLSFVDLDHSLVVEKKPVVIGILHRGSLDYPTGGHMIVVVGKSGKDYIVNDPYGSLNDGYTGDVYNGKGAVYSRFDLAKRWLADGDYSGWGRLFYKR
jgi:Peptidase_C39 like family